MSKKMPIALTVVMVVITTAYAQPPDTLWTKTFGGSNDDYCYTIQQTADGNFAFFGLADHVNLGPNNNLGYGWAVKLNTQGVILWDQSYGASSDFNVAHDGQQTADGGYVLTGQFRDYPSADVWLVKTDADGNQDWEETYNYSSHDAGNSVQQTDDGGYIITGIHNGMYYKNWTIKTNSSGGVEWTRELGLTGSHNNEGKDVQQTGDGGYIVLSSIHVESWSYDPRIRLTKLYANGDTEWEYDYGGSNHAYPHSVKQTDDGGYIFTGWTSPPSGFADVWLVKTDSVGIMQWDHTYGGVNSDIGYCVGLTNDGGYVITGYTVSSLSTGPDVWIIKTNPSGDMEWDRIYGGDDSDIGTSIEQTIDGGYIVGAYTNSFGAGGYDAWVIRLESWSMPSLTVALIPFVTPIQIPVGGGSFEFYLFVTNNESSSQEVDLWTWMIDPYGAISHPLLGPGTINLQPSTTGWHRVQNVPGTVDPGMYSYIGMAGIAPNAVWASDTLVFEKLDTGDGSWISNWNNWGDPIWDKDNDELMVIIRPYEFTVNSLAPNPFNPTTTIGYQLSADSRVSLAVYDIAGRMVSQLVDGWRDMGVHEVTFDGTDLASGVYLYRLTAGEHTASGKMVLMK